jgi:NitT/TauT family transport system substrate-binding protein
VSMKHPDGVMAMLSQSGDITAHFTVPPFSTQELNDPKVHKVLDSYEVYGGQPTQDVIYTTQKFRDQNPKVYRAFLAALTEATATGEKDRKLAAEIFMRDSKVRMDPALVAKVLEDPKIHYTTVPNATLKLARFMERVGIVAQAPDSWKDMFFPEIHNLAGS